jgi:hypothetical protein
MKRMLDGVMAVKFKELFTEGKILVELISIFPLYFLFKTASLGPLSLTEMVLEEFPGRGTVAVPG